MELSQGRPPTILPIKLGKKVWFIQSQREQMES